MSFDLYKNDNTCSDPANIVFSDSVAVDGNGDYFSGSYVVTMVGDYMWQANYSGDANNLPFTSPCPDDNEFFFADPEEPVVETLADPNGPASIGDSAKDTATLSGGFNPTGTISFDLYKNDNSCSDPLNIVFSDSVPVDGNGAYMSGSFVVTMEGDYMWQADYSGDANNLPYTSECPDDLESFFVEVLEVDLEYFVGGGKVIVPNAIDKVNQGKKGEQKAGNAYAKATNKKLSEDEFILTHGFELHCDPESGPNNLEINWNGNQFHLEQLTKATCTDDGSVNEPPPSIDTSENGPGPTTDVYNGEGFGRYNGVCGAFAQWVFDDNGEPGKADHIVALQIRDADGGVVLAWNTALGLDVHDTSSAGTWKDSTTHPDAWLDLKSGNHQWVPHKSNTHGPTQTNPCPEF
jgi:hypothetical protein